MSDALKKPTPEELKSFQQTANNYAEELEAFFVARLNVEGMAEPTLDGNKMQAAVLAMASLVGSFMAQVEAAMPADAPEHERLDLMFAFVNSLGINRGLALTQLMAPDYVERIQVITSSMRGKAPDNLGHTNEPPTKPTNGGQNTHPYLH